jgi:hypothetical protein
MRTAFIYFLAVAEAAWLPFSFWNSLDRRDYNPTLPFGQNGGQTVTPVTPAATPTGYRTHHEDPKACNAENKPYDRWKSGEADGAWADAVNNWKNKDRALGLKFGQSVSNYLGGPGDGYNCQTTEAGSCYTAIGCKDVSYDAG